jgi:formate hydrogenlyase subunit 4
MPYVVSLVVVALIWKVMLIDKVGFINRVLELVGLHGRSWLGDPNLALGAVLVVTIWFSMVSTIPQKTPNTARPIQQGSGTSETADTATANRNATAKALSRCTSVLFEANGG